MKNANVKNANGWIKEMENAIQDAKNGMPKSKIRSRMVLILKMSDAERIAKKENAAKLKKLRNEKQIAKAKATLKANGILKI
jgi:hypothetical protein